MTADGEDRGKTSDAHGPDHAADAELDARVAGLERATYQLAEHIARLAARIDGLERRGGLPASSRSAAPNATPNAGRSFAWRDVEAFIGRYGVLALGTITTLAAVGTFLGWAAKHGLLGPTVRVVLGLLLASALAVGGVRLRSRERSFGSTLMGLALAVTQVCAWAAGPLLHLVSSEIAFAFAVVTSVALATFAYTDGDQPLWCVGFGGSALAPFITSSDRGSTVLLAFYGVSLSIVGGYALGTRAWRIAERVFHGAVAAFVLALMYAPGRWGAELAVALPIVIAAAGVLPFAGLALVRPRLRGLGVFAAVAALFAATGRGAPRSPIQTATVLGVAGLAWLLFVDRVAMAPAVQPMNLRTEVELFSIWTDAAFIPLAFVCALFEAAPPSAWSATQAMVAGVVVLGAFTWRREPSVLRDAAAFAAACCALGAAAFVPWDTSGLLVVTIAVLGVAFTLAHTVRPSRSWVMMAALALIAASARAWWLLHDRDPFTYQPFLTQSSAVAASVLVAWAIVALLVPLMVAGLLRSTSAAAARTALQSATIGRLARAAPWCWAFLWVHRELAGAFSPAGSTLALVSFEAVVAVLAVGVGRARDLRTLRRAGLLLAIVAALRSLAAARTADSVALRVASYLVASAFLLGISYWYRRTEDEAA